MLLTYLIAMNNMGMDLEMRKSRRIKYGVEDGEKRKREAPIDWLWLLLFPLVPKVAR